MKKEIDETQNVLKYVSVQDFFEGSRDLRAVGSRDEIFVFYSAECEVIAKGIDSGLSKLPTYKGSLFRGDLLTDEELERINTGEYSDWAYMSFSIDEEVSKSFVTRKPTNSLEKHPVFIEVESRTGCEISLLSSHPEEKEILFNRGQRFRVVSKETIVVNKTEALHVRMIEI